MSHTYTTHETQTYIQARVPTNTHTHTQTCKHANRWIGSGIVPPMCVDVRAHVSGARIAARPSSIQLIGLPFLKAPTTTLANAQHAEQCLLAQSHTSNLVTWPHVVHTMWLCAAIGWHWRCIRRHGSQFVRHHLTTSFPAPVRQNSSTSTARHTSQPECLLLHWFSMKPMDASHWRRAVCHVW